MSLTVPAAVEAVIKGVDEPNIRLDENELSSALMKTHKELHGASAAEQKGAFAEVAAWNFMRADRGEGVPWGLYWMPMTSGIREDGITPFYVPDVAELDDEILAHWIHRATHSRHPAIASRYADLCWEVGRYLRMAPERRPECGAALSTIEYPSEIPRHAIDGYLAVVEGGLFKDEYDAWMYLSRAVGLATQINDTERKARVKAALFRYQETLDATKGPKMWWRLHDLVARSEKALQLDEAERTTVTAMLRKALDEGSAFGEEGFDPHKAQAAADRLIKWLNGNAAETQQAIKQAGEAFERAAEKASGLLAIAWLEELIPRYYRAGLNDDAVRVEQLIRIRAGQAQGEMKRVELPLELDEKALEDWADQVAGASLQEALGHIAVAGLVREETIRNGVHEMQTTAPLAARISVAMKSGDGFTEATIGSVEDDIEGRSYRAAADSLDLEGPFLHAAFEKTSKKHGLELEKVLAYVMASPFFPDHREALLREGLAAWLTGDSIKAIHLLVPQVEAACRDLVASAGISVREPNTRGNGTKAIGFGKVLSRRVFHEGMMRDVSFHLRTLYTDPRGLNLRNVLAHGLAQGGTLDMGVANLVVHSILMIAAVRMQKAETPPAEQ